MSNDRQPNESDLIIGKVLTRGPIRYQMTGGGMGQAVRKSVAAEKSLAAGKSLIAEKGLTAAKALAVIVKRRTA